jgi:hypothetical protein
MKHSTTSRPFLRVFWSKRDQDLMFQWEGTQSRDGHLFHQWLNHTRGFDGKTLVEELKERGYDIGTLRITVKK